MSILTGRELEFLDSLRTSWPKLYWNELARLRKEEYGPREAHPVPAKGVHAGPGGNVLAFAQPRSHKISE